MATAANLVSLEEYLRTSYSPDCEYIDGTILERNAGLGRHAFTQTNLLFKIHDQLGRTFILPAVRLQVSTSRVRIPDVCVVEKLEEVITNPPLLCVEVWSPDDRWSRVNASIADYQTMGTPTVWVIDPYESRAWIFERESPPVEVQDGRLTSQALNIEIRLADILPETANTSN